MQELTQPNPFPSAAGLSGVRDAAFLKLCSIALGGIETGRLRLVLPSGRSALIGSSGPLEATVFLRSFDVFWRAMRRGTLGFAESYMRGEVECDDLAGLFRFFIDNRRVFERASRGFFQTGRSDKVYHFERDNTRQGSVRNIAAHYDLGNAFYAAWLDPGLTYSSAIFEEASDTLETAQARKIERALNALGVEGGETLLEVGCGWGGFAEAAAARGARVRAITLSKRQLEFARKRLETLRREGREVDVVFEDYRDTRGQYDRIASLEMIEAVGEAHWPVYFDTLFARLRPGGTAVLQAITIRESSYEAYRHKPDFIQRYIFPGGMLPTVEFMRRHAEQSGLDFEVVETFGDSYARTLREWRDRFERSWPTIQSLGFDERFRRMWLYYLTYCEAGFDRGVINVGFYRMNRNT